MAKQVINIGTSVGDLDADLGRAALDKINDNFTEVYDDIEEIQQQDIIIPIGAWDMDADATIDIDLTSYQPDSTYRPVVKAVDIIKDGLPSVYLSYPLNYVDIVGSGTAVNGSWACIDSYTLRLYRVASGFFDSTDFNSNQNRGFVSIAYTPFV